MRKLHISWGGTFYEDTEYEYTTLDIAGDGVNLYYRCVRNQDGQIVAGIDLSDPMVVLPIVLKDLGFDV